MIEYVMSGCGYSRMNFAEVDEDTSLRDDINKVFNILNDPNHQFGILYNSMTESSFGNIFKRNYKDHVSNIYADSGGLQIITQGKQITEEIKQMVYQNQGTSADLGLSFDEIPLVMQGSRSSRGDVTTRFFDSVNFEDMARQTGKNVWQQIRTFDEMSSPTKPIIIIQGNCYDTYMRWCELLMEQIPKEYHSRIGGVAMGAAALGEGTLQDVRRTFYFTQLPMDLERKHLHLLGIGSVPRLLPIAAFIYSGLLKDTHVSYDSTTHSSGPTMGRYYFNNDHFKIRRGYLQDYEVIKNDLEAIFPGLLRNIPVQEFHDAVNMNSTKFKEIYGSRSEFIKIQVLLIAGSVYNFKDQVDRMFSSRSSVLKFASKKKIGAEINLLMNVKSKEDFLAWEREVSSSRRLKSKAVQSSVTVSLESLFA